MSTLTINFNDMIEKMIGNNEELRIKGQIKKACSPNFKC